MVFSSGLPFVECCSSNRFIEHGHMDLGKIWHLYKDGIQQACSNGFMT